MSAAEPGAVTVTGWLKGWPWTTVRVALPSGWSAASRAISVTSAGGLPTGLPRYPTKALTVRAVRVSRPIDRGV